MFVTLFWFKSINTFETVFVEFCKEYRDLLHFCWMSEFEWRMKKKGKNQEEIGFDRWMMIVRDHFDQLISTIWIANFARLYFPEMFSILMFNVQPLLIIVVYLWAPLSQTKCHRFEFLTFVIVLSMFGWPATSYQ